MRIIIYTGKGGVGKTSTAAATGVQLAEKGIKTLVISTDLAHSLSDSFDADLDHNPQEIMKNLFAMELNPQSQLENKWDAIYDYLLDFFKVVGLKDVFAEELSMFPGVEELFTLLEIHEQYKKGVYQAIVLDFPPTASTIRLLSFFDVVGWYMEKFFKIERKSIGLMRKFTKSFMEMPLPDDEVFSTIEDIYRKMEETKEILTDGEITSVRLVLNPEKMVINESQRAYTYLNLYDFKVDALIINKILPFGYRGDFYQETYQRQQENIEEIKNIFHSLEVFKVHQLKEELKGIENLKRISQELYNNMDPLKNFHQQQTVKLDKINDTHYLYKLYMPFIQKEKFKIFQKGGILIIKLANYKQKVYLPQVLSNKNVIKASYKDEFLELNFE
ncbi:ArsA family ATPase [Natronospora cellulosivora (SeqCode)]